MSDNKNKKNNRFSIYWIYAAIGVAIIGLQFFMSSGPDAELKNENVVVQLWEQDYIDEMVIINRDHVDFTLTKEGVKFVKESDNPDYDKLKKCLERWTTFRRRCDRV